ncbi:uncharacterized protein LOC132904673 [Bombus pascuorum]|uniref:uncharacterized protein LOC132904673 n=1 Tax=Bombus pascuorum TaxID=65598 RepID=UPI00298ECB2A|nr:uncharacterized protein LOC132904673 [Bombus pascuorum]
MADCMNVDVPVVGTLGTNELVKDKNMSMQMDVRSRSQGTLCKFTQEVRVVSERPLRRPRRRRLPGGIRESRNNYRRHGRKSCNTVVSRRYGLPTGAYRYTQALCRTEVEYGLYWRHLLHG